MTTILTNSALATTLTYYSDPTKSDTSQSMSSLNCCCRHSIVKWCWWVTCLWLSMQSNSWQRSSSVGDSLPSSDWATRNSVHSHCSRGTKLTRGYYFAAWSQIRCWVLAFWATKLSTYGLWPTISMSWIVGVLKMASSISYWAVSRENCT